VPVGFDAVIAKGMAKNPDDRYKTVQELAAAARAAVGDSAVTGDGQAAVAPPANRRLHSLAGGFGCRARRPRWWLQRPQLW
jgi:serine/threonine-protein kinase